MYTGKISKLARTRGFGFIDATDGREIFFSQYNLVNVEFRDLNIAQKVEFDVEKSYKGPRAIAVRSVKEEA